jgi:hypothetical protein
MFQALLYQQNTWRNIPGPSKMHGTSNFTQLALKLPVDAYVSRYEESQTLEQTDG